jgi:undecaprenyl-diphosphatase
VTATLFSNLVKFSVGRVRPQVVEHMVLTVSASFPSGHALLSAAIILTIGGLVAFQARKPAERRVIAAAAFSLTFLVGLSRIWLGVHWPMDVLAGWMFGTSWAAMTLWFAKRLDRQGQKPVLPPP